MLKKIAKKATTSPRLLLLSGYLVGQGSYFLLLILLNSMGYTKEAGQVVLYMSLFSLAFQFADYGSTTHLNLAVSRGDWGRYYGFIVGKMLVAAAVVALGGWALLSGTSGQLDLIVAGVLSGVIFAASSVAVIESTGKYFSVGLIQALPWVLSSGLIAFSLYIFDELNSVFISLLLSVVSVLVFLLANMIAKPQKISVAKFNNQAFLGSLVFMLPIVVGQLWGRQMIALTLSGHALN